MTTALFDLRSLALAFLLTALASLALAVQATQTTRAAQPRIIILAENIENAGVWWTDDLETHPASDCGHNLFLHIARFLPNDQIDPCNITILSEHEVVRRAAEWLQRHRGVKLEFPNGITRDVVEGLARNPLFQEAVKAVLTEAARAAGYDAPPQIFWGPFPFDTFTH